MSGLPSFPFEPRIDSPSRRRFIATAAGVAGCSLLSPAFAFASAAPAHAHDWQWLEGSWDVWHRRL